MFARAGDDAKATAAIFFVEDKIWASATPVADSGRATRFSLRIRGKDSPLTVRVASSLERPAWEPDAEGATVGVCRFHRSALVGPLPRSFRRRPSAADGARELLLSASGDFCCLWPPAALRPTI